MPVSIFGCLLGTYKNCNSKGCSIVNDINRTHWYNRTFYHHTKWGIKLIYFKKFYQKRLILVKPKHLERVFLA